MATRDGYDNLKVVSAFNPETIDTDGTHAGPIVDTQGFESVALSIQAGDVADGAVTTKLEHGDAEDLSDAVEVPAADLRGSLSDAAFGPDDDSKAVKLGYVGPKRRLRLTFTSAGAAASGTATLTTGLAADEHLDIAEHAFTAKDSGATGDQFDIGATLADSATNLAAAINASTTEGIAGVVTAEAVDETVVVTAVATGAVGNDIAFTATGDHITVTGSGTLEDGNDATAGLGATCVLGHPWASPVA